MSKPSNPDLYNWKERNLSPLKMFIKLAEEHVPECRFAGDFDAWKAEAKPRVLETLGYYPPKVPINPEFSVEWLDRGIRKRRYLIDVSPHISAVLQVNLPPEGAEPFPTLCCWHGHGEHGKDAVMGNAGSDSVKNDIRLFNYDYGHQMAEAGYVTYGIDWMGCGERNDSGKRHFFNHDRGRDWCNLYYLNATMLGMTNLSLNLAHGRAATDFVCGLPEVDATRLGVMGLSGGGTMTLWTALTDDRFKAVEITCYSGLWARFGSRDLNYCGSQVAPELYKIVDLPDLQGLLAPLPLLVDIATCDHGFHVDDAMECYRQVRTIYEAAGAGDRLEIDLFAGDHMWGGNLSRPFFEKYLGKNGELKLGSCMERNAQIVTSL
jgi:dienelactone hydrolase